MKILEDLDDFKPNEKIKCECYYCQGEFLAHKKLLVSYNKRGIDGYKFCSKKCNNLYNGKLIKCECKNCGKEIIKQKSHYSDNNFCSFSCVINFKNNGRKYLSEIIKLNKKPGGYRRGSGRGKNGWYKEHWCDSTWELAWIIYNIDNNIKFERNYEKFHYIKSNGNSANYIPDFIVDGVYIEIKGWKDISVEEKIKYFPNKLKMIYKDDIKKYLEYCYHKYGTKKLETLYNNQSIENIINRIFLKLKITTIEEYIELREKYIIKEITKIYKVPSKNLYLINKFYKLNFIHKKLKDKPNKKNKRNYLLSTNKCECGNEKHKTSKTCMKCWEKRNRKIINKPTLEELLKDVKELGYRGTGNKYGVSDNAVRNWLGDNAPKIRNKIREAT